MSVLILTRNENQHSDRVQEGLNRRNIDFKRINIDDVNNQTPIVSLSNFKQPDQLFSGVFVHHPRIEISEKLGVDKLERQIISATWSNWIMSLESIYGDAMWINRPTISTLSLNIFNQLRLASKLGLKVPDTLFTNSKCQLSDFVSKHRNVIVKTGPLLGVHLSGQRILTKLIGIDDISSLAIDHSPGFFQNYIEKAFELRIHVIGDQVLCCRIESQANDRTRDDWRRYNISKTPHFAHVLDKQVESQCISIVKSLGLEFGIIDMIVTTNGEHVFLECNSQGHWIWIEELTGLPITQALIERLIK